MLQKKKIFTDNNIKSTDNLVKCVKKFKVKNNSFLAQQQYTGIKILNITFLNFYKKQ